jgi:hypothetical protein
LDSPDEARATTAAGYVVAQLVGATVGALPLAGVELGKAAAVTEVQKAKRVSTGGAARRRGR